jgi:hypothetical protein
MLDEQFPITKLWKDKRNVNDESFPHNHKAYTSYYHSIFT